MHIADTSVGMLGATGIVGSGTPIALGAALASKTRHTTAGGGRHSSATAPWARAPSTSA